jgi:hypothetical protein
MKFPRLIIWLAAIVAWLCAVYVLAIRRELEASLSDLHRDRERLIAQARIMAERLVAIKEQKETQDRMTPATNTSDAPSVVPANWDPRAEGKAFQQKHPAVKRAVREYAKYGTISRYGSLFARLKLPPEKENELIDLMTDGTTVIFSVGGKPMSLQADRDVLTPEDRQQQIRAIIGDDGNREYATYSKNLPARQVAAQVAGAVAFSAPLSAEQADALASVVANGMSHRSASQQAQFDWDTILKNAAPVLSPVQLDALAVLKARAQYQAALNHAATQLRAPPEIR